MPAWAPGPPGRPCGLPLWEHCSSVHGSSQPKENSLEEPLTALGFPPEAQTIFILLGPFPETSSALPVTLLRGQTLGVSETSFRRSHTNRQVLAPLFCSPPAPCPPRRLQRRGRHTNQKMWTAGWEMLRGKCGPRLYCLLFLPTGVGWGGIIHPLAPTPRSWASRKGRQLLMNCFSNEPHSGASFSHLLPWNLPSFKRGFAQSMLL